MRLVLLCLLFSVCLAIASAKNPYQTLGISRSSSIADIKRAYKRLAVQYHPDKVREKRDRRIPMATHWHSSSMATQKLCVYNVMLHSNAMVACRASSDASVGLTSF